MQFLQNLATSINDFNEKTLKVVEKMNHRIEMITNYVCWALLHPIQHYKNVQNLLRGRQ